MCLLKIAVVLEKQFLTVFLTATKAADGYSIIQPIELKKKSYLRIPISDSFEYSKMLLLLPHIERKNLECAN